MRLIVPALVIIVAAVLATSTYLSDEGVSHTPPVDVQEFDGAVTVLPAAAQV